MAPVTKTVQMAAHVEQELREWYEELAKANDRSISAEMRIALRHYRDHAKAAAA